MNLGKRLLLEVSEKLALPADVLAGVPRIEILGSSEFCMEPHKGLLEYGTNQVTIRTNQGAVTIYGADLKIRLMNGERIVVGGSIETVDLRGNGNG